MHFIPVALLLVLCSPLLAQDAAEDVFVSLNFTNDEAISLGRIHAVLHPGTALPASPCLSDWVVCYFEPLAQVTTALPNNSYAIYVQSLEQPGVNLAQLAPFVAQLAGGSMRALMMPGLQLNGQLPASWSSLGSLQYILLQDNNLTGSLPDSWSGLTALKQLDVHHNQLTGSLPASWAALDSLQQLSLWDNALSGALPTWAGLSSLQYLFLSQNRISGSLPASWSALQELSWLDLRDNQMTGSLPPEWKSLINLQQLWLDNNRLTGSLPGVWESIGSFRRIWLSNNSLTGPLPTSWGQLQAMERLWLDSNQLWGTIPRTWTNMQRLQQLVLGGNGSICGELPAEVAPIALIHPPWFKECRSSDLSDQPSIKRPNGAPQSPMEGVISQQAVVIGSVSTSLALLLLAGCTFCMVMSVALKHTSKRHHHPRGASRTPSPESGAQRPGSAHSRYSAGQAGSVSEDNWFQVLWLCLACKDIAPVRWLSGRRSPSARSVTRSPTPNADREHPSSLLESGMAEARSDPDPSPLSGLLDEGGNLQLLAWADRNAAGAPASDQASALQRIAHASRLISSGQSSFADFATTISSGVSVPEHAAAAVVAAAADTAAHPAASGSRGGQSVNQFLQVLMFLQVHQQTITRTRRASLSS